MNKKEEYRKSAAELILFDNSDVVATSSECEKPGWSRGNGCGTTSGSCPGQEWK